jgi:hypothetical protein
MPNLAATCTVITLQFPRIIASGHKMFCSFVDENGHPYSAAFKHFDPLLHTSLWKNSSVHIFQPFVIDFCPFYSSRQKKKDTIARCLSWVKISSAAIIFTPYTLGINRLQLNHTHTMSPPDLFLQHDQASAVLPVIQRKYCNNALTF